MSIHKNYLLLTPEEQYIVNEGIDYIMQIARKGDAGAIIPLDKSDKAERAIEAVATWVIESRPKITDANGNAIRPFRSDAFNEDYNRDLDTDL